MERTSSWRTRTYYRITIAAMLCITALALGAVNFFDITAAANSTAVQKETKSVAAVKASPAASAALDGLRRATGAQIKAHVAKETGNYDFVRAADGLVLEVDNTSAAPEERAFSFLRGRGALIGMNAAERGLASKTPSGDDSKSASVLRVLRVNEDSAGNTHVRMNQFYRGLPVFGAQVVVHMNDRGITAINGLYVPDVKISTKPNLSADQAVTAAMRAAGAGLNVVRNQLSIYRKGLLEGYNGQSLLAYSVELTDGKATNVQIWVDATKGAILNRIELSHAAINRTIFTPEHDPLFAVRREGDPLTPGATPGTTGADPINNLYVMAGHTYNMFSSGFGRDSYDGLGHKMDSVYLINDICPNAYWNGVSTNYCPDFDADDVVSHEWGHAYTQYTHGLIYSYQSGALNESYSDIFGESADLLNGVDAEGGSNNAQPNPNGVRWQMGEDVPTLSAQQLGILRDMWTPTRYGDPDKVSSGSYACGSGDGGGVHTNSGVPNHAYAMLVDGKSFNGQTVQGIGFDRALAIYYRAMTVYQTPSTNFVQHANALRASCNDLIGVQLNSVSTSSPVGTPSGDVITAGTCQQVDKAIAAVEMDSAPLCNFSPILDPDTPASCDGATTFFTEDFETGMDGWSLTSTGAATTSDWDDRNWVVDSTLPKDRAGSAAYAKNPPLGQPDGGTCAPGGDFSGQFTIDSPEITIPASANVVRMNFDHYVATEATFDGGQVEVSVNGGAYQLVPQTSYVHNAPNSQLEGPPPTGLNTNPNAGEYAWHGTDTGAQDGSWGTTIVDLSDMTVPGDKVKIRFNFSQDGCNGVDGWYVDNVNLYFCPPLEAPALSLGGDYENPDTNGSYTLNWTRPTGASGPDVLQQSSICGPLMSDNAESGLGQWTAASSRQLAPMWQTSGAKPQHSSTAFWANPVSEQQTQNTSATLTFNSAIPIPASGITTLNFSEWYFNESDDHGFVEVSEDGTTWVAIYDNNRNGFTEDGALALAEEELQAKQLDLTIYSGKSIRLRLRFALGQSNFFLNTQYGWYVDDISITNDSFTNVVTTGSTSHTVSSVPNGTRCYRVRTTYTFGAQQVAGPYSNLVSATVSTDGGPPTVNYIEDNDSRVSYANGWHLVKDVDASDGHFRLNTGKDTGHSAGLEFTATGGGKITYYFARSTKGGTAEVALLSGSTQLQVRTVNYRGSAGSSRDPEFNEAVYKEEFVIPAAGNYTLAVRNTNGAVYIDRFKLESATSNAQPAAGPGSTTSNVGTVTPGQELLQSITVPQGAQAISVMAEASPELPIQLMLIDPSGAIINTANNSTGFAVINKNVTQSGVYVIKVINVSLGPVQVWTAATPLVQR